MTYQTSMLHVPAVVFGRIGLLDFGPDSKVFQIELDESVILSASGTLGVILMQPGDILWLPCDHQQAAQIQTMCGHYGISIEELLDEAHRVKTAQVVTAVLEDDLPF